MKKLFTKRVTLTGKLTKSIEAGFVPRKLALIKGSN